MTIYIDQYRGEIIQKIGWQAYGLGARAMSAGIPLHLGKLGWWNQALSVLCCAAFLLIAFSGVRMWWLRRPSLAFRLGAPLRSGTRVPAVVLLATVVLAVAFALTGLVIVAVPFLDSFLIQRSPRLRKAFG
jgi:uncharacterized iron-regulated membrane protein